MIKVAHLTYDMRIGGTETVIKNLIEAADQDVFDTEILCIEPKLGPFGEQLAQQGVKITNFNWQGGFDTGLIRLIRQHLIDSNVNVLHCHQYTPWVYGCLAALGLRTRIIFTEHGRFYPDSGSWKRKLTNPVLTFFTGKITAISQATKAALTEFEFIPARKIDVVYNGIQGLTVNPSEQKQLRAKLNIPSEAIVLGTVARLDPIKNQVMMLEAFKTVSCAYESLYLLIVGDGGEREALEKHAKSLKIGERVIFTGYESKPAVHIAVMDIFLLSSLSEGTSMTLLEAMSLAKPCVVTDAGGNREVISHDVNGKVTENNNVSAFAEAITDIISNGSVTVMGQKSLDRFNELFTVDAMQKHYKPMWIGKDD